MLSVVRYSKEVIRKARYIRKRCYKNFNQTDFKWEISQISWFDIYMSNNVDHAVHLLTSKISEVLDKYAPEKSIQIRSRYCPWLSEGTKLAMRNRNIAQQLASMSNDEDSKRLFRNLRNKVTNMIRSDRRAWEKNKLDYLSNDNVNIWKNIKDILQWTNEGPPNQIFYDGHLERSPFKIAEALNSFFIEKISNLKNKLPAPTGYPLRFLKRMMAANTREFKLKPVYPQEVSRILKELNNSKSTGLDSIDVQTIKMITEDILPPLTHIINLSLGSSTFPLEWKKAKVIPLLKKGDPICPQNYRPVALLPVLSKILEKVIFRQVLEYVETSGILHASHHGSTPKHSTCTAIIEMYSTWINAVEKGKMAGVVMVDLSATVDLVDH